MIAIGMMVNDQEMTRTALPRKKKDLVTQSNYRLRRRGRKIRGTRQPPGMIPPSLDSASISASMAWRSPSDRFSERHALKNLSRSAIHPSPSMIRSCTNRAYVPRVQPLSVGGMLVPMPFRRRRPIGGSGTLFVLEEDPAGTRRRWYCHWDGAEVPGFDTPEDAVVWGLSLGARGVVVRTLGCVWYLVGERPTYWAHEIDFKAWPPSAAERQELDARYAVAVAEAEEEDRLRHAYEAARISWLQEHAPDLRGAPKHACVVVVPGRDECVEFEELDDDGGCCGARTAARVAFGTARDVLAQVTSGVDHEWVDSVVAALARERRWKFGRRHTLDVRRGAGEMFHVSAVGNRGSVGRHGLDWRRMADTPGIAGSALPELEAIFLCGTLGETKFFTEMSGSPSDVWAVDVRGMWLENGPSGWVIVNDPIPPARVRLVSQDIRSQRSF